MLLLQTQGGETVRLLGTTEGARFGHTHPILSSPSPLAPWDTDFPARLSGTYSFHEEWPHWHLSFILSRWHQSQTKGLRALEREKLGGKRPSKLLSGSGYILRNDAHLPVHHTVCKVIFYPVSFARHTALGNRCHYSHLTGEKGGIVAIQWIWVSHVRSRERDQAQDSPPTVQPPPWAQEPGKVTAPWWDEMVHHSTLTI